MVGRVERERLPDLTAYVKIICETGLKVRLQVREREVIALSLQERGKQRTGRW